MKDDRYQNQILPIRMYRWLRWKPYYYVSCIWWWFRQPDHERQISLGEYHSFYMSLADVKMNHIYTMDEVFDRLKKD